MKPRTIHSLALVDWPTALINRLDNAESGESLTVVDVAPGDPTRLAEAVAKATKRGATVNYVGLHAFDAPKLIHRVPAIGQSIADQGRGFISDDVWRMRKKQLTQLLPEGFDYFGDAKVREAMRCVEVQMASILVFKNAIKKAGCKTMALAPGHLVHLPELAYADDGVGDLVCCKLEAFRVTEASKATEMPFSEVGSVGALPSQTERMDTSISNQDEFGFGFTWALDLLAYDRSAEISKVQRFEHFRSKYSHRTRSHYL